MRDDPGVDRRISVSGIDVRERIDSSAFSPYQRLLLAMCVVVVFLDGFNVQAISVAAPALSRAVGLSPAQVGALFALGSVGGILAGLALAPLGWRIGRRPLIVGSVVASGLLSLGYAFPQSFERLVVLRLATGFTLAIAVTLTYAYAAELAPKRATATAVMITSAGFGLGVAAAGFLSGHIIPHFGWRAIFYIGGATSLAMGLALIWILPESVRIMALQGGRDQEINRWLRRCGHVAASEVPARFHLDEERRPGTALVNLPADGRAAPMAALWICTFAVNFVIYIWMQWLPSLVSISGGTPAAAGDAVGWFKAGGIAGSLACGYYIDRRRNPYPILVAFIAFGCVALLGIARAHAAGAAFTVAILALGAALSGPQYAINGLVARLLPTYVRTSGMAITATVARAGAAAGPFVVGFLLQAGWHTAEVVRGAVIPTLLAALMIVILGWREANVIKMARRTAGDVA
jgi:AAHS family 4-hydroxybenzoate transporter-like MFS transporter